MGGMTTTPDTTTEAWGPATFPAFGSQPSYFTDNGSGFSVKVRHPHGESVTICHVHTQEYAERSCNEFNSLIAAWAQELASEPRNLPGHPNHFGTGHEPLCSECQVVG